MDENSDSDSQQQQPPPSATVEPSRTPSDKPKEPAEYQRGTKKQKRDYSHVRVFGFPLLEFLQVLFDGLLVIAGVIGTIVIIRQLNVMERQMADSKTAAEAQDKVIERTLTALEKQAMAMTESIGPAAKDQATASTNAATEMKNAATANAKSADQTERIAKSSERSIESTRDALRLEQRAWLGIQAVSSERPRLGEPLKIVVTILNTGKTPAMGVNTISQVRPTNRGEKLLRDYSRPTVVGLASRSVIGSGATLALSCTFLGAEKRPVAMTERYLAELNAGLAIVYVHGRITYSDVFEQSHWLTYCYEWNAVNNHYDACDEGNDTDTPRL